MKIRIFVYTLLALVICLLTTLYLLFANQDRILEAGRYKLSSIAKEKWDLDLTIGESGLILYRNTLVFNDIILNSEEHGFYLKVPRLESTYHLASLLKREISLSKVRLEKPVLKLRPKTREAIPGKVKDSGESFRPEALLAALAFAQHLEVEGGRVHASNENGDRKLEIGTLGLRIDNKQNSIITRLWFDTLKVDYDWHHSSSKNGFLRGGIDKDGLDLQKFELLSQAGPLRLNGLIKSDGTAWLDFDLQGDLEGFRNSVEGLFPMTGQALWKGRLDVNDKSRWEVDGFVKARDVALGGNPLPDLGARMQLTSGGLQFSQMESLIPPGGLMTGQGAVNWGGGLYRYNFEMITDGVVPYSSEFLRKTLPDKWLKEAGPQNGTFTVRGRAGGGENHQWQVVLDLQGSGEKFFGPRPVQLAGTVENLPGRRTALKEFRLHSGPTRASWSGILGAEAGSDITVLIESDDFSTTLEPYGLDWIGGEASFAGSIQGRGEGLEVAGGLMVERAVLRGVPADRLYGPVRYSHGTYSSSDLRIEKGGGFLSLNGFVSTGEDVFLDADIDLHGIDWDDGQRFLKIDLPVRGSVSGEMRVAGLPGLLSGKGVLTILDPLVKSTAIDKSTIDFSFDPYTVYFHELKAFRGEDIMDFEGSWQRDNHIQGRLSLDLHQLANWIPGWDLDGSINLDAQLEGRWPDPEIEGSGLWRRASFREVPHPDLSFDFFKKEGRLKVSGDLLERYPASLDVSLDPPYLSRGRVSFEELELETVLPFLGPHHERATLLLRSYGGLASGEATMDIPLSEPEEYAGEIAVRRLELTLGQDVSRLKNHSRISFSRHGFGAENLIFEGDLHQFRIDGGLESGRLDLSLEGNVDLSILESRIPQLLEVSARPDVFLKVTGEPSSPWIDGSASLEGGKVKVPWLKQAVEDISFTLDFDRQSVRMGKASAVSGSGKFEGSGWYNFGNGVMDITLSGVLPLESLERFLPGVREYRGQGQFDARIWGSPNDPGLDVEASLNSGFFRLEGVQIPLQEVSMLISMDEEGYIRIREAATTINSGIVKGRGYLVWPREEGLEEVDLDFSAEKIYLATPDLKMVTFAELAFTGTPGDFLLSGQLVIERGKYFRNMTPRPVILLGQRDDQILPEKGTELPLLSDVKLDLRLLTEEGFWIDNNVARINSALNLAVGGSLGELLSFRPTVSGDIQILEGDIFYLGKEFHLGESSAILFTEDSPLDPYMNIEAETTVSDVVISLFIGERLSSPSLILTSVPPYSQEDIISLLTFGAPRSTLDDKGGDVSALGAAMVFSGGVVTRLEDEARNVTGLEVFQVEPTFSGTGGAARVLMGKRLSDRIFLSYSRNLSITEDQRFTVEYQLHDFVSLVGQQNTEGVYSFELVLGLEVP
jgi:hypothetical protein